MIVGLELLAEHPTRRFNAVDTLGQIEEMGWHLVHVGYVFVGTGSRVAASRTPGGRRFAAGLRLVLYPAGAGPCAWLGKATVNVCNRLTAGVIRS